MPVVKGGVWTNAEDEILKVAVSKYGLNQWARISSLQHRKTAKQCKARWTQWLDPAIKKTEWSKEEDEKLLHLAKLLPQQWLTIAPRVGRTAQQCIERYDKLLSDAQARENDELGLTGPEGGEGQAPSADDIRRLRPGEVDPDPESKPARPDTVDMDEDEKEMLSEARARLANTQGKKAKRKARERQLEESRRLAALQKRRELKNAGINIKISHRKKGEMDYNADIPFEKKAAPGFFDTQEEMETNEREREAYDPRKSQLANKRKADQQEQDNESKRRKGEKNPDAASAAAAKAGQMQRLREAEQSSKRRSLVLPAPQVGEGELEDIVKMGMVGERASRMAGQGENEATRGLVGSYSAVQSTPIRTPRAPPQEDRIANEVRNIRALTEAQSSLLGGENTPLHEGAGSTGFEGATPRQSVTATPNPMAAPLQRGTNLTTSGSLRNGTNATPLRTPRDNLAINRQQGQDVSMKARLAALPKPKESDWELELPEEIADASSTKAAPEEDAAERDRRNAAIAEAARQAELRRRSQTLQKNLPRPANFNLQKYQKECQSIQDGARRLVADEMGEIIAYEAYKYHDPNQKVKVSPKTIDRISDEDIAAARALLRAESSNPPELDDERMTSTPQLQRGTLVPYGDDDEDDVRRDVNLASSLFDGLVVSIGSQAQDCNEREKKLALHFGGYQQRSKTLRQKISDAVDSLEKARVQLASFQTMQVHEESALLLRLSSLRDEVAFLSRREREAQDAYRERRDEVSMLRDAIPNGSV